MDEVVSGNRLLLEGDHEKKQSARSARPRSARASAFPPRPHARVRVPSLHARPLSRTRMRVRVPSPARARLRCEMLDKVGAFDALLTDDHGLGGADLNPLETVSLGARQLLRAAQQLGDLEDTDRPNLSGGQRARSVSPYHRGPSRTSSLWHLLSVAHTLRLPA